MDFKFGKTVLGAIIVGVAALIGYLGSPEIGDLILKIGVAIGIIGAAHKLDKIKSG